MPVVGFLDGRTPDGLTDRLRGFRRGLKDAGYVEGENVTVEYRWGENQAEDRQPRPEERGKDPAAAKLGARAAKRPPK
jgi:hypothetical protein